MNFIPPPFLPSFICSPLSSAGLLGSSYVSHHYRANPSMTMFNFLWGIWSAAAAAGEKFATPSTAPHPHPPARLREH